MLVGVEVMVFITFHAGHPEIMLVCVDIMVFIGYHGARPDIMLVCADVMVFIDVKVFVHGMHSDVMLRDIFPYLLANSGNYIPSEITLDPGGSWLHGYLLDDTVITCCV
jgi:hypothetical protein